MNNNKIELSERLSTLCGMVKKGSRLVDVGCDHGFVPIFLVQNGICPHVLAMDVRTGPLSRAQEHISEYGLNEYIDTRLSDGLDKYRRGEADALICAGMGGKLMLRILLEAGEKTGDFSEMVLQPQSDLFEFRNRLRINGYYIADEEMVLEGGKYYFLMKAIHAADKAAVNKNTTDNRNAYVETVETAEASAVIADHGISIEELYDRFGEWNINKKSPLLLRFLTESLESKTELEQMLLQNGGTKAKVRLAELQHETACIRAALNLLNRHIY